MDWETLFRSVDDFCRNTEPHWRRRILTTGQRHPQRARRLTSSEAMTILIAFHRSDFQTFHRLSITGTSTFQPEFRLSDERQSVWVEGLPIAFVKS
jgi:hypothetical protein